MICVLVVGAGAAWEHAALTALNARSDITVLKRCVDVNDLLAVATLGQADVALVGLDAPGFDAVAVDHLTRHRVHPVGVAPNGDDAMQARAARIGVRSVVAAHDVAGIVVGVESAGAPMVPENTESTIGRPAAPPAGAEPAVALPPDPTRPRIEPDTWSGTASASGQAPPSAARPMTIAVWGPGGAPGRTTLAVTLAATLARRGEHTLLVDADPWGGAVAQQLGIVDDVSGLLQLARVSPTGDEQAWWGAVRHLERHLDVVTGLPRAERWDEVPGEVVDDLVRRVAGRGHVVFDTGFCLETDEPAMLAGRPERNGLTLAALDAADAVLVVGTPDPVGLTRLARGIVELRERQVAGLQIVLNRARPTLGWSQPQLLSLLADIAGPVPVHFAPDDRAGVDRALVTGQHPVQAGDGPFVKAVAQIAQGIAPRTGAEPGEDAGQAQEANSRYSPPAVNATITNSIGN